MSYCAIEEAFTPLVPGGPSSKKSKKTRSFVVPSVPAGSDQEAKEYSLAADDSAKEDLSGRDSSGRDLSGRDSSGRDPSGRDLSGRDPDRPAQRPAPANDILSSPASNGRLEALISSSDFFPMQGNNAEPEAWQKAFLLGNMSSSVPKPSFQVDQKPTLWRSIPKLVAPDIAAAAAASSSVDTLSPITGPDEIGRRLEALTKQLDSLTVVTPMQNTAELFLFVAIGLLLLLAIDTLLRYATATATAAAIAPSLQVMSGGFTSRGRGLSRRYI